MGNPGRRYLRTRHSVGFRVLERVAARAGIPLDQRRWRSLTGRGPIAGEEVVLLLPQTYMNASGAAVAAALRELPVADPGADLLVVLDDADLPLGRLRLRARGGDGGHRGLADVLASLGGLPVPRLRFGIGRPAQPKDTVDWVLERFTAEEEGIVGEAVERAAEAVACFVAEGIGAAMNRYNPAPGP